MKNIIEGYIGIWVILILLYLCLAFTSINMNVVQARNIINTYKVEVSSSNGEIVNSTNKYVFDSASKGITLANNGYAYKCEITRLSLYKDGDTDIYTDATKDSTFVYNNMYKVQLYYTYTVPLFGKQVYPISILCY